MIIEGSVYECVRELGWEMCNELKGLPFLFLQLQFVARARFSG
jgi:hypothetical protein